MEILRQNAEDGSYQLRITSKSDRNSLDMAHDDLSTKYILTHYYDFWDEDQVPQDTYGHGTNVAGVAAAATDNHTGIAGVAWNSDIMPLRIAMDDYYFVDPIKMNGDGVLIRDSFNIDVFDNNIHHNPLGVNVWLSEDVKVGDYQYPGGYHDFSKGNNISNNDIAGIDVSQSANISISAKVEKTFRFYLGFKGISCKNQHRMLGYERRDIVVLRTKC